MPTLFSNSFVRSLVLISLGVSVMSWANADILRRQRLVPLPLAEQYRDMNKAYLPPFLPDQAPRLLQAASDDEAASGKGNHPQDKPRKDTTATTTRASATAAAADDDDDDEHDSLMPPQRFRKQLQYLYDAAPNPRTWKATLAEFVQMREDRRIKYERMRRSSIYDELVALQTIKKRALSQRNKKSSSLSHHHHRLHLHHHHNHNNNNKRLQHQRPLGYALVTGASQGIGRAIAVELARWEIPLILVARDVQRLTALANDIERCYGVKCCVLRADLSKQDAAEQIFSVTQKAGLDVDILVNNAGVASSGEFVDADPQSLKTMVNVNTVSVASLSNLYGADMKRRGRGRILIVSSIMGDMCAGPTVAAYAATKSFERVLALSISKELEPYGIGVTCLMPGAVNSEFEKRSGANNAIVWKIPYYAKTPESVASTGVRAMLRGDQQVMPGWANRVFAKIAKPVLPQRLITVMVETVWNPLGYSIPKLNPLGARQQPYLPGATQEDLDGPSPMERRRQPPKTPPKVLSLPEQSETTSEQNDGQEQDLPIQDLPILFDTDNQAIVVSEDETSSAHANEPPKATEATETTVDSENEAGLPVETVETAEQEQEVGLPDTEALSAPSNEENQTSSEAML